MGAWSKSLEEITKRSANPGAIVKSMNGDFGMVSQRNAEGIKIVGVIRNGIYPTSTDKVIAEFPNVSAMIEAGWVVD